ncbi:hypothetical protein LRAMOSA04707 [Lichtheimia ramosa]|uniref:Palmitoyltransferase n=1 Tax=Lichtheimia ramosa TaxID=688394 RepID=A0A077WZZ6_9FUNG|nr:hypothetical protein LRAMOSA04707 [Lichtheimia ramosa]
MSKVVDKAVDKAGPIFIAIGVFLIDLCVLAFYGVVFPYSHSWSDASFFGKAWIALVLTFTLYMVYCIHFHYYMAIKTPPGTTSSSNNSSTVDASSSNHQEQQDVNAREMLLDMQESGTVKLCKKCHLPKPERAHHCSVCNKCIMRFDHHCPWIHNCVGHFNHRYFVLFMTYLVFSAAYFVYFGWRPFIISMDVVNSDWPYYFPRPLMAFCIILAICMGLAIGGLCGWHYFLILTGQTTVEYYNNDYDKRQCKRQGEVFINMYDFGVKQNFCYFFNISERFPWYTVLYPIPIPPRGNGRVFEKCEAFYLLPRSRQNEYMQMQNESQDIDDMKDF